MAKQNCNEQLRSTIVNLKATNVELTRKVNSLKMKMAAELKYAEQRRVEEVELLQMNLTIANETVKALENTIRRSAKWYNIFLKV